MRNILIWAGATAIVVFIVAGLSLMLLSPNPLGSAPAAAVPAATNTPRQTNTALAAGQNGVTSLPASPLPVAESPLPAPAASASAPTQTAPPVATARPQMAAPQFYTYKVVNVLPHDPNAFTEGLVYTDGIFYEGTGGCGPTAPNQSSQMPPLCGSTAPNQSSQVPRRYGPSWLHKVDPATGKVLQQNTLADEFFGEGISVVGDKIYQLTWRNHTGFIYDKHSFEELQRFTYPTEGWGMTYDGERLIVSDGTPSLYFWDPVTLQETGRITVTYQGQPVMQLNELEYVDGEVLANIWTTNTIVRIDPRSGVVTGVVDLTGLLNYGPAPSEPPDVLNGIAYDAATGRLFVTGKLWPALFEIKLVEVK